MIKYLSHDEQDAAILSLQQQLWRIVIDRFEQLKVQEGLKQADLARALRISGPQIHVWLTQPDKMTLKAAGRLLLAMRGRATCDFAEHDAPADHSPAASGSAKSSALARRTPGWLAWIVLAVGSLALFPVDALAQPSQLPLEPLTLRERQLGGASIVMFWRADCAPCLNELLRVADLEHAAEPLPFITVALDEPEVAVGKLKQLKVTPKAVWRLKADPARTLQELGGAPPRLPLAVAFYGDGEVCRRRVGLLGADTVREWAKLCSK